MTMMTWLQGMDITKEACFEHTAADGLGQTFSRRSRARRHHNHRITVQNSEHREVINRP